MPFAVDKEEDTSREIKTIFFTTEVVDILPILRCMIALTDSLLYYFHLR